MKYYIFFIFFIFYLKLSAEEIDIINLNCKIDSTTTIDDSSPIETIDVDWDKTYQIGINYETSLLLSKGCGGCVGIGTYKDEDTNFHTECIEDGVGENTKIENRTKIDRYNGSLTCLMNFTNNNKEVIIMRTGTCEKTKKKF